MLAVLVAATVAADKPASVVVIGSPNMNPGYRLVGNQHDPQIAADFAKA